MRVKGWWQILNRRVYVCLIYAWRQGVPDHKECHQPENHALALYSSIRRCLQPRVNNVTLILWNIHGFFIFNFRKISLIKLDCWLTRRDVMYVVFCCFIYRLSTLILMHTDPRAALNKEMLGLQERVWRSPFWKLSIILSENYYVYLTTGGWLLPKDMDGGKRYRRPKPLTFVATMDEEGG